MNNYVRNSTADNHVKNHALNLLTETRKVIKEKNKYLPLPIWRQGRSF